jgi:hypothetical protein
MVDEISLCGYVRPQTLLSSSIVKNVKCMRLDRKDRSISKRATVMLVKTCVPVWKVCPGIEESDKTLGKRAPNRGAVEVTISYLKILLRSFF